LDRYNIASVRPTIVDPEIVKIKLNTSFKFNSNQTTKTSSSLETLIRTTISNYNASDLEKFDGIFRFSKLSRLIDATDPSILSNITTVRMQKTFTPTLNAATKYELKFSNQLYHPHAGHNSMMGGITSSTGFNISGQSGEFFMDDDGNGNIRAYSLVGGTTRTYLDTSIGSIDYTTGLITLDSLNVTASSETTGITITVIPSSNDIVPVRNQLLEIDLAGLRVTGENDTIESGGSSAGTGYTTSSSY